MLSLTRRIGESIVIGEDIFITILACQGNQVRIGFHAPESVDIHRYEIYQKIQYEKEEGLAAEPTKSFSPSFQQPTFNHH